MLLLNRRIIPFTIEFIRIYSFKLGPMNKSPKATSTSTSCLYCGNEITGRTDKKFCTVQCKAQFNNRKKNKEEESIQKLNRILRKNRNILKEINNAGHSGTQQEALQQMGFDFRFYTHQVSENNTTFNFCYEWGYSRL